MLGTSVIPGQKGRGCGTRSSWPDLLPCLGYMELDFKTNTQKQNSVTTWLICVAWIPDASGLK